jgi:Predicted membrane protein (DUF2207)
MTWLIGGPATVLAAVGDTEFIRDNRVLLWFVAAGAAAGWVAILAMLAAANEPRRVTPGPSTLELGGTESPAVVNLVTDDWVLGHEAVPATLLDLAARRYLELDQQGDDTLVRVTSKAATGLHDYERMVYEHVRGLSRQTADGVVHAQALTTGPDEDSERWWKRFHSSVIDHAQALGLSRNRWSAAAKAVLTAAAVIVAAAVGVACLMFVTDPEPGEVRESDEDPTAIPFVAAGATFVLLGVVTAALGGQRDTGAGREAAAGWLGLGDMLSHDNVFAEQPPAGVAIWDRHIAYGAALGISHGAVAALPLGAESETEAWSPVTGRWRVVRIRYPRRIPPGYGRHPGLVTFLAALRLAAAYWLLPRTAQLGDVDVSTDVGSIWTPEQAENIERGLAIAGLVLTVLLVLITVFSLWRLGLGLADLLSGRRPVEGRVLRGKEVVVTRNDTKRTVATLIAVDDGTADKVRAWRIAGPPRAGPGDTVYGEVTRYLAHVRNFTPGGRPRPAPAGEGTAANVTPT